MTVHGAKKGNDKETFVGLLGFRPREKRNAVCGMYFPTNVQSLIPRLNFTIFGFKFQAVLVNCKCNIRISACALQAANCPPGPPGERGDPGPPGGNFYLRK